MSRILKIVIAIVLFIAVASVTAMMLARRKIAQLNSDDAAALLQQVHTDREKPSAATSVKPSITPPPVTAIEPAPPVSAEVQLRADLQILARLFAERWGTFTNQEEVSSVASMDDLFTTKFRSFSRSEDARLRTAYADPSVPYRIDTRALNVAEQRFSGETGEATYLVATQRVEMSGIASNRRIIPQSLDVRMRQEGGLWKIDGAFWKPIEMNEQ